MEENIEQIQNNAKSFFELTDRYLILDLNRLVLETESEEFGGLGYPCMHTILVAMELLGMIMSGKTEGNAFFHFWENYLEDKHPKYKDEKLKRIFKEVIRNGTAHIYFIKPGISINRTGPHLEVIEYRGDMFLHINLKELFLHFLACYNEIKLGILQKDEAYLGDFQKGYRVFATQMEEASQKVSSFIAGKDSKINTGIVDLQMRGIKDTSTSAIVMKPPDPQS